MINNLFINFRTNKIFKGRRQKRKREKKKSNKLNEKSLRKNKIKTIFFLPSQNFINSKIFFLSLTIFFSRDFSSKIIPLKEI